MNNVFDEMDMFRGFSEIVQHISNTGKDFTLHSSLFIESDHDYSLYWFFFLFSVSSTVCKNI